MGSQNQVLLNFLKSTLSSVPHNINSKNTKPNKLSLLNAHCLLGTGLSVLYALSDHKEIGSCILSISQV